MSRATKERTAGAAAVSPAGGPDGSREEWTARAAAVERVMTPLYGVLARILRIGVIVSAVVIALGLVLYLVEGGSGYPHGAFPRTPAEEVAGLGALRPYAVIALGLFLLAATPVVRVAVEVGWFVRHRTWTFFALAAFTLTMLLVSFVLGRYI